MKTEEGEVHARKSKRARGRKTKKPGEHLDHSVYALATVGLPVERLFSLPFQYVIELSTYVN